jgi:hypothetical protein
MLEDLLISTVVKIQHETTDPWFQMFHQNAIKTEPKWTTFRVVGANFGTRPKYWTKTSDFFEHRRHKPNRPSTPNWKSGKCAAVFLLNALEKCQRGLRFTDSMFKHFPRFHYRNFGPHPNSVGGMIWKNASSQVDASQFGKITENMWSISHFR